MCRMIAANRRRSIAIRKCSLLDVETTETSCLLSMKMLAALNGAQQLLDSKTFDWSSHLADPTQCPVIPG
eukprot:s3776_g2.t1